MIFTAQELLAKLNHLTLTETDGEIEFIGTDKQWTMSVQEADGVDFNRINRNSNEDYEL
jgi:hypothetical protein